MSVAEAAYVDDSVNSKTFWHCLEEVNWPDAIDIISLILEVTAIILNTYTGILLLRIKDGDRVSLVLLRTFVFNNVIDAVIKLIGDSGPSRVEFENEVFNHILCFIWDSRFFYWLFNTFAIEAFTMFAVDRAISLRKIDFYPFVTVESRLRAYQVTIYAFGIIITLPQFLSVNLSKAGCTCEPTKINVTTLSIIYAHTFLRFVLLEVLNGAIQLVCSAVVIIWIRQTDSTNEHDELNYLLMKSPSNGEVKLVEERCSWKTSSMCILPIAILFIITYGFDSAYQFFSGTGVTTYIIGGAFQRAGTMLMMVFSAIAPVILLAYIPALRLCLKKQFKRLKC